MLRVMTLLMLLVGLVVGLGPAAFSQPDAPAGNALESLDQAVELGTPGDRGKNAAAVPRPDRKSWQGGYSNAKYGFAIAYPERLFTPQGESDAGDGQGFLAADGASLAVYAAFNVLESSLEDVFREALAVPGQTVTYRVMRQDWFVVSGLVGKDVFYRKTMAANDAFYTVELRYPQAHKELFDPLVGEIVKSFVVF